DAGVEVIDPSSGSSRTALGAIRGEALGGIGIYRGLRYALPPTGDARWTAPLAAPAWDGTFDATRFGPACMQPTTPFIPDGELPSRDEQSEDCLTLNVWTAARTQGDALPVMVWIHGGGWTIGSGSARLYDGSRLASEGVVVVTFNYRLGPLGYLAHELLDAESPDGASGNYGMRDQLLALEWVRDHVRAFGGDPGNVTVFGESAGAGSVCNLLVAPSAFGLFHRAVIQSASCIAPVRDLRTSSARWPSAHELGASVEAGLACDATPDPLACMRAASFDEIAAAGMLASGTFEEGNKFWPVVDGLLLPEQPRAAIEAGRWARVPVIAGSNRDEAALFRSAFRAIDSRAAFEAAVQATFGARAAPRVLEVYPVASDADAAAAYEQLITDFTFACPARRTLRAFVETAATPAWLYQLTQVHPSGAASGLGAYHGADILYVFGNLNVNDRYTIPEDDERLADAVVSLWTRFAATGDPNVAGGTEWPPYDALADAHLALEWPLVTGSGLRRAQCDVYDSFF
ncbi:MAG: carboxylesterase family protein, partial [Deltaproteobacteria bacterium]|nr:carboxylesterase family protein [Deltaproteobacteria bacterium]